MNMIACDNEAGNLTTDRQGYSYEYDYENRIVKITEGQTDIAEYSYDALGRRVEKKDCVTSTNTRRHYYDKDWRVLDDYDGSGTLKRRYMCGNYIDEVLFSWLAPGATYRYYVHDHLHSTVALLGYDSSVLERYEAACPDMFLVGNAYGEPNILDGSYNPRSPQASTCDNSYLFTGRQVDILDGGALKIQYNRNRYYDYYTGRWTTQDPLGSFPNADGSPPLRPALQYVDGMNTYQYCNLRPLVQSDALGFFSDPFLWPLPARDPVPLRTPVCPDKGCPIGWLDPLPSSGSNGDWHEGDCRAHYIGTSGNTREFSHRSVFAQRLAQRGGFFEWSRRGAMPDQIRSRAMYYAHNLGACNCTCFGYSHSGVTLGWAITERDGTDDWSGIINLCGGPTDAYCGLSSVVRCCVKRACEHGEPKAELVCRVRFVLRDKYSLDNWPEARWIGRPYWHIVHFDKILDEILPLQ